MTQREKRLATIVGVLLGVFCVTFVAWRIYGAFSLRASQLAALAKEQSDNDMKIQRGKRAGQILQDYANRALPSNPDLARTVYKDWLVETVAKVGLQNHKVTAPQGAQNRKDVYTVHTFRVIGEGNVQQLIDLLYEIYCRDVLHRVQHLTIAPIKDKKDLHITLVVEAVAMPTAPDRKEISQQKSKLVAGKDLQQHRAQIAGRNLFAPENKPPDLRADSTLVAYRGQRFEFKPQAEDPDKLDKVAFEADVSKLPGARFSSDSGTVEWTPSENGEYQMTLIARDDGFPAREVKRELKITVKDPLPTIAAKPSFDVAKHAYITGVTESNGKPEVWVLVRTEGRTLRLNIGEPFRIGEMEGKIAEIDGHRVVIDAGGERITTRLGQPIVQ